MKDEFFIDYKSRLTPFECLVLYLSYKHGDFNLEDFEKFSISQSMIERYNAYIREILNKLASNPEKYDKIVDWDMERPKTQYFRDKMEKAHEFEVYIENLFRENGILMGYFSGDEQYIGETKIGVEIKNDEMMLETGNIYIEYQERMKNCREWQNSGILKNDNTLFWIIGAKGKYYIIEKSKLIDIYQKLASGAQVPGCMFRAERAHGTSKGFIIKKEVIPLVSFAASIPEFVGKLKTMHKKIYFGE